MDIKKLNKHSKDLDKFVNIIYKNFLDLEDYQVVHDKKEIKRQILSDNGKSYYLMVNNVIVGYIISEDIVIQDGRFTNFIYYLYVSSKHRGKGYSKILLELVTNDTKNSGTPSIMLMVRKNNLVAQNLYKNNGFVKNKYDGIDPRFIVLIKHF